VDVGEHALPGCVAQDDVEGVDLSDLITVVIAWINGTDKKGIERLSVSWWIDRNAISRGSVKEGRTNAKRPRMHTESAREMARRTPIKPADSCSSWGRCHRSPEPSWGANAEARKMSLFVVADRSRLTDRAAGSMMCG
jgi:hypothetical protein